MLETFVLTAGRTARRVSAGASDRTAASIVYALLPAILGLHRFEDERREWTVLRATRTQMRATVALLARGGKEEIAVKVVDSPRLATQLLREAQLLGTLNVMNREACSLVPELINAGNAGDRRYLAVQAFPGVSGETFASVPALRTRALRLATEAISGFHAATGERLTLTADRVASWTGGAIVELRSALGGTNGSARSMEVLERRLHEVLEGQRVDVGWIHGDYWLGNVLVTPDGSRVTGIVDWDAAHPDHLQLLDPVHLALYADTLSSGAQYGDTVARVLAGGGLAPEIEQVLDRAAPEFVYVPDLRRAATLMCWLRHVSTNFAQSERYARSTFWMRRNVLQVLSGLSAPRTVAVRRGATVSTWPPANRIAPSAAASSGVRWARWAAARRVAVVDRASFASIALAAMATALWAISLGSVDVRRMTDIGLVSALPPLMFVALAALAASFVLAVFSRTLRQSLLLVQVVLLVLIVYGTPALVEEVPRFAATWRHMGIADYIARRHSVDPNIDAYFNWPGFFALLALFDGVTGVKNAAAFASWSPVVLNLLYLGPLLLIFRSVFADRRLVWLSTWVFYLTNWVAQDYLSPQGLSYFLYLTLLAVLLRWFVQWRPSPSWRESLATVRHALGAGRSAVGSEQRRSLRAAREHVVGSVGRLGVLAAALVPAEHGSGPRGGRRQLRQASGPARKRMALGGLCVALLAVLASMHQLTPFAALLAVTALVLARVCTLRGLPLIGAVLISTWMIFMADAYLAGHFGSLAGGVGDVGSSLGDNVGTRLAGSTGHLAVVAVRLVMSAGCWLLAIAGAVHARRLRVPVLPIAILALAPFPLIGLQDYGGEILLRIYFFALPFTACFVALLFAAVQPGERIPRLGRHRSAVALLGALSVLLLGGLLVARYGNERMDAFTKGDLAAVDAVYSRATPGSVIVAANSNMPWKFRDYESLHLVKLTTSVEWRRLDDSPASIDALMARTRSLLAQRQGEERAYVLLTTSQQHEIDVLRQGPRDVIARLRSAFASSPDFVRVAANRDGAVFVPARGGPR